MIGTMANPSRPSVRLTALPEPTMTKAANGMKNQAEIHDPVLEERKGKAGGKRLIAGTHDDEGGGAPAIRNSSASREPGRKIRGRSAS